MFKYYRFQYKQSFISCLSPLFNYIIIQVVLLYSAFTAEFILGHYNIEINTIQNTIVITSITVIAELIFILFYHRDIKELFKNSFRYLLDVINIKFVIILIFFNFLIRGLVVLPTAIILLIDNGISDSSVFSNLQGVTGYFGSIMACTLTPIFEEILFRGLILRKFCDHGVSFKNQIYYRH